MFVEHFSPHQRVPVGRKSKRMLSNDPRHELSLRLPLHFVFGNAMSASPREVRPLVAARQSRSCTSASDFSECAASSRPIGTVGGDFRRIKCHADGFSSRGPIPAWSRRGFPNPTPPSASESSLHASGAKLRNTVNNPVERVAIEYLDASVCSRV